MNHVGVKVKVLEVSEVKEITTGEGVKHQILELKVEDETGTMPLVLWDEKVASFEVGEKLQIENAFVTSFKGSWRINVGRYGEVERV